VTEHEVRTSDGRTLAVQTGGADGGLPVLVHMGTPNSRHLYARAVDDAASRGMLLISYDRPGYGGSTAQPGRSIADCTGDVRSICGALGIGRIGVWGISGGGPHALACAALLSDLVVGVASLASPAPYDAQGLDYFAGMGQDNVDDIKLQIDDPAAARAKAEADREALHTVDFAEVYPSLLSPADAAVVTGELASYLERVTQEGLAPGIDGWFDDGDALVRPWGFVVDDIAMPVLVLHGRQDSFVPFAHGEWLAQHIPGVEARLTGEDGHLTLLEHRLGDVHSWLRDKF
jgi:pimeloyl-ACP methyl ester carboxylesterase